jgi:predicted transcriptional regulator with HTH domain
MEQMEEIICPYSQYALEPRRRGNKTTGTRILPAGSYVTHNQERRILNLHINEVLVLQVNFSPRESDVLALLLAAYPDIAYHEEIRSAAKGEDSETSATIVGYALERKQSDDVLRPVRCIISHVRAKLILFNMEPVVVNAQGYMLYPIRPDEEYLTLLKKRIARAIRKQQQEVQR